MKTKLIAFIILISISFCNCTKRGAENVPNGQIGNYNTIEIDSCEYLEYDFWILDQRVYSFTHKGNCKFCYKRKLILNGTP